MVCEWEPGTWYDLGSVVVYQGHNYKIIEAHQSQSGWEPPATPALWGRIPEEYHEQHHERHEHNEGCNPPPQQPPVGGEKPWDQHSEQKVPIHEEERKTGWAGLSDERKKEIEIGGGLVAGLAALAGGFYAYHKHEENEEEKKSRVWDLQNWLHTAQENTKAYYEGRMRGPLSWILVEDRNKIPTDIAIPGGNEYGQTHYICRGSHEGSLQIGKASDSFRTGAIIGYGNREYHLPKFEVLVGDKWAIKWVDSYGTINLNALDARPVEGGREADGSPLWIAQASYRLAVIPGKCGPRLDGAFVPYDNSEKEVKNYRVLCYA